VRHAALTMMPRAPQSRRVRVSDDDRERTVRVLRGHFAAGRLTLDELEDRLERAHGATYRDELRALVWDLPWDVRNRMRRGLYRMQRRVLPWHAAAYATASGSSVGTWALTGAGEFWPAWVLVWGGALLGSHAAGSRSLRKSLDESEHAPRGRLRPGRA
jgi:hypothetical protein